MIRFNRFTGLISASGLLICALLFASVYTANAKSDFRLGTAGDFGVLAGSTVTNTGPTFVSTNVGVWPGKAATGWFPPGEYGGTLHLGDAVAQEAQTDLVTAYTTLAGLPCEFDLTDKDLGNQAAIDGPLVPGVYCFSSSAQLTGSLVLDAQGLEDPLFVFQVGSTLTTAPNASVSFVNGTSSCNVYWQVTSSATLDTNTSFTGNIVALTSISLLTGADISGRALARNGAVRLDSNTITNLNCSIAQEPPSEETTVITIPDEPATDTPVPVTSTSIPATSTSVPATSTPTDRSAPVGPGSGSGEPQATLPVATATLPGSQSPTSTVDSPEAQSPLPSTPTEVSASGPGATDTAEQTPSATVETDSTAAAAVSTPVVQAPVAWPTSTTVPEVGTSGSVTFPNTGTQGRVVLNTNTGMSTTSLAVSLALILLATAALVVTADRRSRR